jgi:hypothetical protein
MSWKRVKPTAKPIYSVENPLFNRQVLYPTIEWEEMVEAIVEDVIVNDEHPLFDSDVGYSVGSIRFRAINYNATSNEQQLNWAYPIDANSEEFPLKNEIVRVFKALNRFYYTTKINLGNNATHQAYFGIHSTTGPSLIGTEINTNIAKSAYAPSNEAADQDKLGEYFSKDKVVYRLRHWEGDRIIEGRTGNSIRFGSAWLDERIHKNVFASENENQSPNMLFRVGPADALPVPDSYAGRVVEDINLDKTSLWMVSDQIVPIRLATVNEQVHGKSIQNYPSVFGGGQFIVNSDRVVLNSRTEQIMLHARNGVNLTSATDITLDSTRNIVSLVGGNVLYDIVGSVKENVAAGKKNWVRGQYIVDVDGNFKVHSNSNLNLLSNSKISLQSPSIFIGSDSNYKHPMVFGDVLVQILQEFIKLHLDNTGQHGISACGSPVALSQDVASRLQTLSTKLNDILSLSSFVGGNGVHNEPVPAVPPLTSTHDVYTDMITKEG